MIKQKRFRDPNPDQILYFENQRKTVFLSPSSLYQHYGFIGECVRCTDWDYDFKNNGNGNLYILE